MINKLKTSALWKKFLELKKLHYYIMDNLSKRSLLEYVLLVFGFLLQLFLVSYKAYFSINLPDNFALISRVIFAICIVSRYIIWFFEIDKILEPEDVDFKTIGYDYAYIKQVIKLNFVTRITATMGSLATVFYCIDKIGSLEREIGKNAYKIEDLESKVKINEMEMKLKNEEIKRKDVEMKLKDTEIKLKDAEIEKFIKKLDKPKASWITWK